MYLAYQGLGHRKLLATTFISKVISARGTKKRIYIISTLLSKKILKNIGFVFKHYQVNTGDKTLFTLNSGVYTPKEGEKLIRDAIYLDK